MMCLYTKKEKAMQLDVTEGKEVTTDRDAMLQYLRKNGIREYSFFGGASAVNYIQLDNMNIT